MNERVENLSGGEKADCRHTHLKSDYDSYVESRLPSMEKQTQVARSERSNYEKQQEKLRRVIETKMHALKDKRKNSWVHH